MGRNRRARALGAAGTLGAAALTAALGRSTLHQWSGWGTQDVAAGLALLVTVAAAACAALLTVTLARAVLLLLDEGSSLPVPGSGAPDGPGTPLSRRVAAALLAVSSWSVAPAVGAAAEPPLVSAAAQSPTCGAAAADVAAPGPADAVPDGTAPAGPPSGASGDQSPPAPGWTPTVVPPALPAAGEVALVTTTGSEHRDSVVVVRRGDTLWDITARHLGDGATDQDVAEQWPLWYAANRDVIGADPDLIHPGQRLVPPSGADR